MQSLNIADQLAEMAKKHPDMLAVAAPLGPADSPDVEYQEWSYAQLYDHSSRIAAGLLAVGYQRGDRVILMVPPGPDFFALTFALFTIGVIPVLIDPGIGISNLGKCIAEAEACGMIAIPKGHIARILLRWGGGSLKKHLTVGRRYFWGGHNLHQVLRKGADSLQSKKVAPAQEAFSSEDLAAILFTSGSTGVPKGVLYRHGNFSAQVKFLRELYDIKPGEVDLPTFPLFALFAPALGMSSILPDMDPTRPAKVKPQKLIAAMKRYRVDSMFGSPALLNTLSRYCESEQVKLSGLKRVLSAGAPVGPAVLNRMKSILNADTQVFTPYGATESLPVSSIGSHELLESASAGTAKAKGVCVGQPVSGINVKIIRIDDGVIERLKDEDLLGQGQIGEICVHGPQVTRSYYKRPSQTRLAKIALAEEEVGDEGCSGEFMHRMGDLGYFDDAGRLWFCGRKAHRVICKDQTYYSVPCEGVFNAHPAVNRSALVGVQHKGELQPLVCIELEKTGQAVDQSKLFEELRELAKKVEHTQRISEFLIHEDFPVDIRHNAKIFREKLAVWAQAQVAGK